MDVHSSSITGRREQNEDKHIVFLNGDGKDKSLQKVNLFAVFDGHGGKEVSAYLENVYPRYMFDKSTEYPLSKKRIASVYDHIQNSLKKYNYSRHTGSTSLAAVHFKHNGIDYLNVLNTGDSRCVLCRDNFGIPLTKDHKPNWPGENYRITQLGGKITFDGFDWRIKDLSVSRAFGDVDATPYLTHRPDIFRYRLDKNDKFIVLACDGLWDVMSNQDVVNFILLNSYDGTTQNRNKLKGGGGKKINIADMLVEYAYKKGSQDNITVIVVFFK